MPDEKKPSGENTGAATGGENKVVFTPEQQAVIDAQIVAATSKANGEAAAYRVKENERKAAEAKAAEDKLIADGKSKELAESLQKELAETKSLAEAQKAKLDKVEADRRKELIARLPQDKAKNYETVPLDILETIAADFAAAPASGNSQGNDRGGGSGGSELTLEGMSLTQLYELMKTNPTAYKKLMDK